jgi:hypothetical protein
MDRPVSDRRIFRLSKSMMPPPLESFIKPKRWVFVQEEKEATWPKAGPQPLMVGYR